VSSRFRQIAIGAAVACRKEVRHLIRHSDGTIGEINTYSAGFYPPRSAPNDPKSLL
jgi:hypothetical protein